jgi:hypothetical protein
MAVDLGRGQAPLYPVNKRENYRIHVSCEEWGEETLYVVNKGDRHHCEERARNSSPVRKDGAGILVSCEEGDRNPCIL